MPSAGCRGRPRRSIWCFWIPFRRELLPQVCELLEQRGWLAPDALIYLEREKEMADLPLPASWQLLKDKQAGQVCYQLYLRDTKYDAAV